MTDSERIEIIVLPRTGADPVVAALAGAEWDAPSVVAVVVTGGPPHATALRFFDERGHTVNVDLASVARRLSQGGRKAGIARLDPVEGVRAWESWIDGEQVASYGCDDELWVPRDADGRPDLDAEPERFPGGAPDGWRRVRSCLDLGMETLYSCRFTPVGRLFERMRAGESVQARAFVLVRDGGAVSPPSELPWQALYRS